MTYPIETPSYELLCSGLLVVLSNSAVGRGLVPAANPAANPPGTVAAPRGVLGEQALTKLRARVASVSKELRGLTSDEDNGWPAAQRARDWARANALLGVAKELRDGEFPDPQGELSAELEALCKAAAPPGSTTRSDDYATLTAEWKAFLMPVKTHAGVFSFLALMSASLDLQPGQPLGSTAPSVNDSKDMLYFLRHGKERPAETE